MKGDSQGVVGADIGGEPIDAGLPLGLEAAKQAIPDDQNSGMIPVDVLRVSRMVNAVVRRGIHHQLENAHAPDGFRMNPELV